MIQDIFMFSLKNLRKRKLRTWLTMLGIIIAIATIFILIGLSLGLNNAINEQFRMLGTDKILILPLGQAGAPGSGGAVELTVDDVKAVEKVSGVKSATYFTVANAKIQYRDFTRYFIVAGVPLDDEKFFTVTAESLNIKIDDGRFIDKRDKEKYVAHVGNLYKETFGASFKVGSKFEINGITFETVGILKTVGNSQDDQNVYIPIDTFKKVFNSGDRVDEIFIQINQGEDLKTVANNIELRLRKFRDVTEKTQDFSILTPEELLASFGIILNIITAFLLGVAGISLVVGGVGIMNTMYTAVLERTKEIGTMKAVGARNSDILKIFLIESGILGLVGGLIGIGIGFGVGKIIEYIAVVYVKTNLLTVYYPWYVVIGVLAFSFVAGSVAGLLPALQASKLKPVDALRYE